MNKQKIRRVNAIHGAKSHAQEKGKLHSLQTVLIIADTAITWCRRKRRENGSLLQGAENFYV